MRRFEDWLDSDSLLANIVGTLILGTALIGGVYGICLIALLNA